jgi:hypothetical protein
VSRATLPGSEFAEALEKSYLPTDNPSSSGRPNKLDILRFDVGLTIIHYLTTGEPGDIIKIITVEEISPFTITLVAFSSPKNPWSTPDCSRLANTIFHQYLSPSNSQKPVFAILHTTLNSLLLNTIKPLFSHTPHPHIPPSARKTAYPQPSTKWTALDFTDPSTKPWKYSSVWAVPALHWLIAQYRLLDFQDLEVHFPLLVPPILNLIDDEAIAFKIQGCQLLLNLLLQLSNAEAFAPGTFPGKALLRKMGLDDVFFDALISCTTHLPTLTLDAESAGLLQKTYATLLALDATRFPEPSHASLLPSSTSHPSKTPGSTPKAPDPELTTKRLPRLRLTVSKILNALHHIRTHHPLVACVLLTSLMPLICTLGIESVRYLQDLIPLLNTYLTHPFATTAATVLISAIKCYEVVIRTCAARMETHYAKVLVGLCGCWYRLFVGGDGMDNGMREEVRRLLRVAVGALRGVLEERGLGGQLEGEVKGLVRDNGWLEGLFSDVQSA